MGGRGALELGAGLLLDDGLDQDEGVEGDDGEHPLHQLGAQRPSTHPLIPRRSPLPLAIVGGGQTNVGGGGK